MSDFGFDSYALDGENAFGQSHPLEIARDLIATGKPRSALEVLGLHHDALVDDPDYLLICYEAWWAKGDALRAQQALLGAVRQFPSDPRPLHLLAELLAERGEAERAEKVRAKAAALDASTDGEELSLESLMPEQEEDLIAFAERQERSHQAHLSPRQILLGLVALAAVGSLIAGIAVLTRPAEEPLTRQSSLPPQDVEPVAVPTSAPVEIEASVELAEFAPASPEPLQPTEAADAPKAAEPAAPAAVAAAPQFEASDLAPEPKARPKARPKAKLKAKPKTEPTPVNDESAVSAAPAREPAPPPPHPEPDATTVRAELASMSTDELTARGDVLYRQGHTALAATYFRRALDLDPDFAPALVGIGRSILRAEKYADAMSNATRALQLARGVDARPGLEAEAIYQIARVHLHRGDLDAARRLFRQSISLPGTPSAAWFYLGEALWNDNSPAAREAYEKYLELVPTGPLAIRARRAIQ